MSGQPEPPRVLQEATGSSYVAQAAGGSTAQVIINQYAYQEARPRPVDPGELAAAEARLREMPLERVPPISGPPRGSWITLRPNPLFLGREPELRGLAEMLKAGRLVAITGIGGVGKTQLAVEFTHRYGQFFAGGVFWLSFADAGRVAEQVSACGGPGAMSLAPDFSTRSVDEQVRLVLQAWQDGLPRLLVFDNCEDSTSLAECLPPAGGCRVLVTSRRPEWDPVLAVQGLALRELPEAESTELLRMYRPDVSATSRELRAIAAELGDLPLALHLAGSFLKEYRDDFTPAEYLSELRRPDLLQGDWLQPLGLSPTGDERDVARTFSLSYERLRTEELTDRLARGLLAKAICFAPGEPVPRRLLLRAETSDGDARLARLRTSTALNRLVQLGLVERASAEAVRVHRLVAAYLQQRRDVADAWPAARDAVAASLAREYEHLRVTMPSGSRRTAAMSALVSIALSFASRAAYTPAEVARRFDAGADGDRLVALAAASARLDPANFPLALEAIEHSRSAFEQYHALLGTLAMLPELVPVEREQLRALLDSRRGHVPFIAQDASRRFVQDAIRRDLERDSPEPLLAELAIRTGNPNLVGQVREWQAARRSAGQDIDDWPAVRLHLRLVASDPGPHAPSDFASRPIQGIGGDSTADGSLAGEPARTGARARRGQEPGLTRAQVRAREAAAAGHLVASGIDATTGRYVPPPTELRELVQRAAGSKFWAGVMSSRQGAKLLARIYPEALQHRLSVATGIDTGNIGQIGWGVVFARDADPAIRDALDELLAHRRSQAGEHYREYSDMFGVRPGESADGFLARHQARPGPVDPVKMPHYLLLVGDPETISYEFEAELGVRYAVGRLHLETPEAYAAYACSVVAAETGPVSLPRRAAFFGTQHPNDQHTLLTADSLVRPLSSLFDLRAPDWSVETVVAEEATKARLGRLLGGTDTPALLATASHSVCFPRGDARQLVHQGALLCQEWPGPEAWRDPIPPEFYFASDDVSDHARLQGLVAVHVASYSAGTPRSDKIGWEDRSGREGIAPSAFVGGLPRRLLSHPKGAPLAVVGHVERAWIYPESTRAVPHPSIALQSLLMSLASGMPVGEAVRMLGERDAELASDMERELEELSYGKVADDHFVVDMLAAATASQRYAVVGDPAVRLAVESASSRHGTSSRGGVKPSPSDEQRPK